MLLAPQTVCCLCGLAGAHLCLNGQPCSAQDTFNETLTWPLSQLCSISMKEPRMSEVSEARLKHKETKGPFRSHFVYIVWLLIINTRASTPLF